jgi:hypothetical protein
MTYLRAGLIQSLIPREISFYIVCIVMVLTITCTFFGVTNFWIKIANVLLLPIVFTYSTGLFVARFLRITAFDELSALSRIVSFSLIGAVTNGIFFSFIGLLHLFTVPMVIGYFLALITIYIFLNNKGKNYPRPFNITKKMFLESILPVLVASCFSLAIAIWFQPLHSFPNLAGWDTYTHMLTVRTIIFKHGISQLNLEYLPTTHYFYAAESILTNTDPFLLYWGSIYFLLPLAGASFYFLGSTLGKNKLVGICTAIFGVTIGSTNELLGLIFPFPSTYGLIITILANAVLLSTFNKRFLMIYVFSIIMVYQFALAANLIILVGVWFYKSRRSSYIKVLMITITIFVTGLYLGGSFYAPALGMKLSTEQVWRIIESSYVGWHGLILIMLGGFFIYYHKLLVDRRITLVLTSTATILLIIISGWYIITYRLEEFIRPYTAFVIGYGIGSLTTEITKLVVHQLSIRRRNNKKKF